MRRSLGGGGEGEGEGVLHVIVQTLLEGGERTHVWCEYHKLFGRCMTRWHQHVGVMRNSVFLAHWVFSVTRVHWFVLVSIAVSGQGSVDVLTDVVWCRLSQRAKKKARKKESLVRTLRYKQLFIS